MSGEDVSFFKRIFRRGLSARYAEGIAAYNAGRWDQALTAFRHALEIGGSSSDPLVGLARFYAAEAACHLARSALDCAEPERALEWLEPAMQWKPRDPAVLFLAALADAEVGDLAGSARCLRALLEENPSHAQARVLTAAVEYARGKHDRARQHLELAGLRGSEPPLPASVLRVVDSLANGFRELESRLRNSGSNGPTRRREA